MNPLENLLSAVRELDAAIGVKRVSRTYEAAPVGAPHTPTFLNAAVAVETGLTPARLKHDVLRPIEARLGRVRTSDINAPRTIDIDIALVEDLVLQDDLTSIEIPDPDVARYAHLAFPLRDLDPTLEHPVLGRSLAELAEALSGAKNIRMRDDIDLSLALADGEPSTGRPA